MAVNLSKGGKISLQKCAGEGAAPLEKLMVGLGWDCNQFDGGAEFDLDCSVFMVGADGKTKEEEIIDYMNSQLEPGLQGMVSSTYFGFVKNILEKLSGSGAATGLFSSVLSGVVYYFDTLANVIPTLSLAGLYYSYQMRKAERLGIYYGLKPRP